MRPEAIPTTPSAVHHVARPGSQSVAETAATDPHARCFPLYALSAARIPKYPLNLVVIGQSIVATAIVKLELADRASLTLGTYIGRGSLAYVCQQNRSVIILTGVIVYTKDLV